MNRRRLAVVLIAIGVSFAAKIALVVRTYGTNDVLFWEANLRKIQHEGGLALYRDGAAVYSGNTHSSIIEKFNQPPFMIHALEFWGWLTDISGLPLRFWLRFTSSIADIASVLLLLLVLRRSKTPFSTLSLVLVILCPVSVMVSGFHGNTDPLMMAFLLFSLYLIERGSPWWLSGAILGMAMNIKVVPLVFIPAVFLCSPRRRDGVAFVAGALGAFVAGSMPELFQDPRLIYQSVFGYSASYGVWGFSALARVWLPGFFPTFATFAKPVMLGLIGIASIWMHTLDNRPPLILQFSFIAFLFLSLTPGFGVQYIAWLVPWTATLNARYAAAFQFATGLFLFTFYQQSSHGLWYMANTLETNPWHLSMIFLGLGSWLVIVVLTVVFARRVNASQ